MPKVRGNGSTIQLDTSLKTSVKQTWELRVNIGRDKSSNKYRTITRRFHGTLTQAKKALRELINKIECGDITRRSDMSLADYCDAWVEEQKTQAKFNTVRTYRDRFNNVKLHLGKAKIHEITSEDIENMYKQLMDGKSVSGRNLSGTYVDGIHRSLHRLFNNAVDEGHIAINPCDKVEKPKIDTPEKLTVRANDISKLIEELDPTDPTQLVIIMALRTGMRRGEIYGLSWGDIDFDAMEIHIQHSYDVGGNLTAPKTLSGIRDIPIPQSMVEDLKKRLDYLKTVCEEKNLTIDEDTPIICNDALERELPSSATRWWSVHRESLGFKGLTIHGMRHSFLSEMARRKVDPKVLQKLAGHSKISTTLDIYTHVDMEDKREAIRKIDW